MLIPCSVYLIFAGLYAPILSASLGGLYLFGRVLYTLGYTTGDASARNTRGGIIAALAYYRKLLGLCLNVKLC
jgi:glutathione S-transferase